MSPSEVGERAEAAVLAALAAAGKQVLIPFGQHRFDFAYEDDGRLVKVQCKTGVPRKGVIHFLTCSVSRHGERRDYRDDVDLFAVYCHERCEVYIVPVEDVPSRAAHLRLEPARNGQKAGIREAEQYLLSRDGKLVWEAPLDRQLSILTDIDVCGTLPGMATTALELPVLCCAPLSAPTITEDEAHATAEVFKALSDPHRVRIINLLATAAEPVCVCDINAAIDLSQPTISFHLKKLAAAGLLTREKRGTWAYYSIDRAAMKRLGSVVQMTKGT